MTIEMLKQNIERETQIMREIINLYDKYAAIYNNPVVKDREAEIKPVRDSIMALLQQLKILNNAVPELVESVVFYTALETSAEKKSETLKKQEAPKQILNVKYIDEATKKPTIVAIKKKDQMSFLKSLTAHKLSLKKINPEKQNEEYSPMTVGFMKSYAELSNRLFANYSHKLIEKQYFDRMKLDLRKIASSFVISSYVSIMLFSFFISFFLGLLLAVVLIIFGISIATSLMIILLLPLVVGGVFFFYPSSSRKSLEKLINQELPFLVIYMAAISTSGIEPSKIFSILVASRDYPYSRREIKKLTNYINFYGYDLVTALKAVSKNCPSDRLAQMFDGFATTITSGGSLTEFLNKHSESLLFDYRLEREKYTHVAETFMNIYISVVIAAPMIMMVLFVLMKLTGFGGAGLSISSIGVLSVLVISMLNVGFLVFLNSKQPKF